MNLFSLTFVVFMTTGRTRGFMLPTYFNIGFVVTVEQIIIFAHFGSRMTVSFEDPRRLSLVASK